MMGREIDLEGSFGLDDSSFSRVADSVGENRQALRAPLRSVQGFKRRVRKIAEVIAK